MPGDEKSGIALLSLGSVLSLYYGGRCENLGALTQIHVVEDVLDQYEFENGLARGSVKVSDVFHLIVGTGTGGLVACMLGPLKMSTKEAKKAYLQIWGTKFWSKSQISERMQILKGALTSLLDSQREVANDGLSTAKMTDVEKLTPNCKFAVTATMTASSAKPVILRAYRGRGSFVECTLLEALLATLAYDEILPAVPVGEGMSEFLAATTTEYCNPTEALLAEIPSIFKSRFISVIVSIGSGRPNPVVLDGQRELAKGVLPLAESSHVVAQGAESQFSEHSGLFVRLDVDGFDLLGLFQPGNVISHARAYLVREEIHGLLDRLVHSLMGYPKRLEVRHVSGLKVCNLGQPEIAPRTSDATNSACTTNHSLVHEHVTTSDDVPSAYLTPVHVESHSFIPVKRIMPSPRLGRAELQERFSALDWGGCQTTNGICTQILDIALSLENEDETRRRWTILRTILCIAEPLSATAVARLLSMDEQIVTTVVQSLYPILIADDLDRCIYTSHSVFHDFVASNTETRFPGHTPSIHLLLAQGCIREMATSLRFNVCNMKSSFTLDRDLKPTLKECTAKYIGEFLTYASKHWWFHIKKCDAVGQLSVLPTIEPILKEKGIFWIEAMSLLGDINGCTSILQEVMASPAIFLIVPSINSLALEAKQLVSLFSQIPENEKRTSQLYLSCLAFFKETPGMNCWRAQFPYIVRVKVQQEHGTPELEQSDGHTHRVRSTAFSRYGRYIVSGSDDTTICIWEAESGQKIRQLEGHSGCVNSVAFSSDGRRIVSGSSDVSVRIWDVESSKELRRLNGHNGSVNSIAFSPDGRYIVSGSDDRTVCIWDAESGKLLRQLKGHKDCVRSVSFSPSGNCIVSGSWDCVVRIWDAESGQELRQLKGHTDYVDSVAFSPDSTRIVSGSWDKSVRIWDSESGKELRQINGHTSCVHSTAFSSNGKRIVSGSEDRGICIWDVESGQKLSQRKGHTDTVNSVAFSPDGKRCVSGSSDMTIRVWAAEPSQEHQKLSCDTNDIRAIRFSLRANGVVPIEYGQTLEFSTASIFTACIRIPPIESKFSPASQPPIELPNFSPLANTAILSQTSSSLHCDDDGWLVGSTEDTGVEQEIVWIPPAFRPIDPQALLLIARERVNTIDLSGCVFGEGWEQCYAGGT
ncbi:hypothetical protein DL96DRAFT_1748244 [Flagelloscypha sp. PMI_526]|nr:hypothetical protein DL96DRAFT_1748244 [Flagelloscypha sp. PMI_526]